MTGDASPFDRVRMRSLAALYLVAMIPLSAVSAHKLILHTVFTVLPWVWIGWQCKLHGVSLTQLLGPAPLTPRGWLPTLLAIPLLGLSLATFWIVWFPLSFIIPSFVKEAILAGDSFNVTSGSPGRAALAVLLIAGVVPVTEEITFRGFFLHRGARKWGARRAALVTSLAFGLLHFNFVGGFVFGLTMAVLYARTGTLWVPIACHSLNNAIGLACESLESAGRGTGEMSLAEFRSQWWIGAIGLLIGVPAMTVFFRRYWPGDSWPLPYLIPEVDAAPTVLDPISDREPD